MGTDAARSVTNADARFHGVENAFVAGPATFPSVGSPNPMLTGIALGRRLGDLLGKPQPYAAEAGFTTLFNGFDVSNWTMTTIKNQPGRDNPGSFRVRNAALESVAGNDMGAGRRIFSLVRTLGLDARVISAGLLTGAARLDALAAADVVVYPSRDEIFGLVPLEALLAGTPVIVCNDSGLMHTAIAVGTPVVAIYGPTDIRRTAPIGQRNMVIRHELPCSPCFKLEGDDQVHACPHHDCLMTITPDEVFHSISSGVIVC